MKETFKVIIAGSRDFNDFERLCGICDYYLQNKENVEIVCGMARGADLLGKKYGEERGYSVKEFPADWDGLGKRAGYVRNEEMAKYGDSAIIFWNGISKGTKHMIDLSKKHNLLLRIYNYLHQ